MLLAPAPSHSLSFTRLYISGFHDYLLHRHTRLSKTSRA